MVGHLGLWDCHSALQSLRNDDLPHPPYSGKSLCKETSENRKARIT
ncbi:MAG: hypothetical protein ACI4MS_03360 [Candidatus Coproplasma sp.]